MIDSKYIQQVRELPIEQVAGVLGLTVSRHKSLCPFHDDSLPSLTFNTGRNTFHCFVCDSHVGTIDLAMRRLSLGFGDAVRWLAAKFGIIIDDDRQRRFFSQIEPTKVLPVRKPEPAPVVDINHLSSLVAQPYLSVEAHSFLFGERKLHPAVVRWLGISSITSAVPMSSDYRSSWFNAPSLLIPYRDIKGDLMSVQARYLGSEDKPRFQFPRGSRCHIFNLPVLSMLKPDEELWIAEGASDCMALLSSGRKSIAIPSATLLKSEDLELLLSLNRQLSTSFHIYPDQDAPGARLYLGLKDALARYSITLTHHQLPEGCKDFGEYWSKR